MQDNEAVRRLREELAEVGPVRREIDDTLATALGELGIDEEVARAIVFDRHRAEMLARSDAHVRRPQS